MSQLQLTTFSREAVNELEAVLSRIEKKSIKLFPMINYDGKLDPETIKAIVANYLKMSVLQMESPDRPNEVVEARFIAMSLIKKHIPRISLKAIGKRFGNRDHSTVIHALSSTDDFLTTDRRFKEKYNACDGLIMEYLK